MSQFEGIEYAGVRITRQAVELRGKDGSLLSTLPCRSVHKISLARGFTSERPLLQLIIAAALLLASLYYLVFGVLSNLSGRYPVYILIGGISMFLLGGWLLWTALKRGLYLRVDLERGFRRYPLGAEASAAQVRQLLTLVASLGYAVDLIHIEQVFSS
jgi:hypothetical protein